MSAEPRKSVQVMVRLDPEMREALEAHAAAHERNLSQTIRYAIRRYLATRPASSSGGESQP